MVLILSFTNEGPLDFLSNLVGFTVFFLRYFASSQKQFILVTGT